MATNELLNRLGINLPIIQGPMGGGPSTPELVAAVSNAGGLGSLGAAYLTPDKITEIIRRIKALTDKPFNVNLFAGGHVAKTHNDPGPMLALLAEIHEALKLPPPVLPQLPRDAHRRGKQGGQRIPLLVGGHGSRSSPSNARSCIGRTFGQRNGRSESCELAAKFANENIYDIRAGALWVSLNFPRY